MGRLFSLQPLLLRFEFVLAPDVDEQTLEQRAVAGLVAYGALASGDTVSFDGKAWIGHGVPPDEIVQQKQSDLLAGKDSIHEAALACILGNLKVVTP